MEAMRCGAVALTTDAPPMNELVGRDRGILVPFGGSKPQNLGVNYYVDESALEAAIDSLIAMPTDAKAALGERARTWAASEAEAFTGRFLGEIKRLLGIP